MVVFFFLKRSQFLEKKNFFRWCNYGMVNSRRCTQDAFTTSSLRSPLKHVNKGAHGFVLCGVSPACDARSDVHAHLIDAILFIG